MGDKISGYIPDGTSNPLKGPDLLDVSNWDGVSAFDLSKKITITELLGYINNNVDNIYSTDGVLSGDRTITTGGNFTKFSGGSFIVDGQSNGAQEAFTVHDLTGTSYNFNVLCNGNMGNVALPADTLDLVSNEEFPVGISVRNTSAVNFTYSTIRLGNDTSSNEAWMSLNSSTNPAFGGLGSFNIGTINSKTLSFFTNGTSKVFLTPTGDLGVGTTPSARIHVKGSGVGTTVLSTESFGGDLSLQVKNDGSVYNSGRTGITTNTAFGLNALIADTNSGQTNTAFGNGTLSSYVASTPGFGGNTAVGNNALSSMIAGTSNTVIGNTAMSSSTSGTLNIAIGSATMSSSSCSNGIGVGDGVMTNASGQFNTSVGSLSSSSMTSGTRNTALGYFALNKTTTGGFNVVMGNAAMFNNVSGSNNVAIGNNAGSGATGSFNLFLGSQAGASQGSVSNQVFIDTISRGSAAADLTNALIHGITDATVSNQRLRFNANVGIGGNAATITSTLNIGNLPTSSAGLATGDVWNSSGTLMIV